MGNSFGTEGIIDRFESAGLIVKVTQVVLHEGDEPDVLADLLTPTRWPAKTVLKFTLRFS